MVPLCLSYRKRHFKCTWSHVVIELYCTHYSSAASWLTCFRISLEIATINALFPSLRSVGEITGYHLPISFMQFSGWCDLHSIELSSRALLMSVKSLQRISTNSLLRINHCFSTRFDSKFVEFIEFLVSFQEISFLNASIFRISFRTHRNVKIHQMLPECESK